MAIGDLGVILAHGAGPLAFFGISIYSNSKVVDEIKACGAARSRFENFHIKLIKITTFVGGDL